MQAKKLIPLGKVFAVGLFAASTMPVMAAEGSNFVEVDYNGGEIRWSPTNLPKETTGMKVNVVYTPNDLKEDSFLDERTYEGGSKMGYPFFEELRDGVYTWEVRVETDGLKYGFEQQKEEGPIDRNGRQVAIVGEIDVPKGRTILPNRGRDLTQIGSFRVIKGKIVNNPELVEK